MQPIDKQSLLDSGILCCLIHILNAFLSPEANQRQKDANSETSMLIEKENDNFGQVRQLEVALILQFLIFDLFIMQNLIYVCEF